MRRCFAAMALVGAAAAVQAATTVDMHRVGADGIGEKIGTITAESSEYGVVFVPRLTGLEPGPHGFHLHENPACGSGKDNGERKAALAAGGHFDPDGAGRHRGPYDDSGHLGDLPVLHFAPDNRATVSVLAPRFTLDELEGHALVIHQGGDNYSDEPEKLGGGGARVACGVIP